MYVAIANEVSDAALTAIMGIANAGGGGGTLYLCAGPIPNPNDDLTNLIIAELPLPSPAFVRNGPSQIKVPGELSGRVERAGRCRFARVINALGQNVVDLDVGEVGSDAAVQLTTTWLDVDAPLVIRSLHLDYGGNDGSDAAAHDVDDGPGAESEATAAMLVRMARGG